jgi:hypothetical protein
MIYTIYWVRDRDYGLKVNDSSGLKVLGIYIGCMAARNTVLFKK